MITLLHPEPFLLKDLIALFVSIKACLTEYPHPYNQAHIKTILTHDILPLLWSKLVINAAVNPLTALLNVPNGFLASHPTANKIMLAIAVEVTLLADALRVNLPYNEFISVEKAVLSVVKATNSNRSSML